MINTNELRRLALAVQESPRNIHQRVNAIHNLHDALPSVVVLELIDRLEEAEADTLAQARMNGMGASREAALMAKLEAAENERDVLRDRLALESQENGALRDSVDRACEERDELRTELKEVRHGVAVAHDVINTLRARIEAAEKEVAHIKEVEFPRKARAVAVGWETKCVRLEQERTIDEQRIVDLMAELNRIGQENEELRVRIEEMERQEPVKIQHRAPFVNSNGELVGYSVWIDGRGFDHWPHRSLYALPGAKGEEK